MKRLITWIVVLVFIASRALGAGMSPVTGRVVARTGEPVEYATVVLTRAGEQAAGAATDAEGRFSLNVPAGDYLLSVRYVGCVPLQTEVRVDDGADLGDLVLLGDAERIESVEVKAQLIRREADRFVVDVANAPAAAGRDGIELLERAPGVWLEEEKISINGKSGTKIYVNDRELRMDPAQLMSYLRSLRAEEIRMIEIIPTTGADYDADASGGVIRITLRKRRENGLDGSLSANARFGSVISSGSPGGNVNIHSGKLDFYLSAWGYFSCEDMHSDEQTVYGPGTTNLTAHSDMAEHDRSWGGTAGAVFEFDARNSIGAEFAYTRNSEPTTNVSGTDFDAAGAVTRTDSRYVCRDRIGNCSATFNYIRRIDTLGSTLKLLADYTHRTNDCRNDNFSRIAAPAPAVPVDSLYRDRSGNSYDIAAVTLAFDKHFSSRWILRAGAKYTRNGMENDALYEYAKGESWIPNERQSFTIDYTEHIAAAYGVVSAQLGRFSFVAGLRGEYTAAVGRGEYVSQNYFSLFPNANLSWSLTGDGSCSLVAQYARTIDRPGFWQLSPRRKQISDYTYQAGNPALDPAYRHDVNLTLVLKSKYAFTAGVTVQTGEIQQAVEPDADDPNLLSLLWVNYDRIARYYLTANLPFQFTRWWQANLNATYIRDGQRVAVSDPLMRHNEALVNLSTTFTLPADILLDLSWNYMSRMYAGTACVGPQHHLEAGVKKRFGDRFTVSFSVQNLLDQEQTLEFYGDGFVRTIRVEQPWNSRSFRVGLTWNFKSGKAFNRKSVEAGAAEERSRL